MTPSSPVSPWIYIVSSDRDVLPFKDITLALTRIITHVNNCDVFEDCVQSKRRRELLGSTSLFGKIALYDDDLLGLVSGRKERRMQQVNGYQVFGALQCPSRPPCCISHVPLYSGHPKPVLCAMLISQQQACNALVVLYCKMCCGTRHRSCLWLRLHGKPNKRLAVGENPCSPACLVLNKYRMAACRLQHMYEKFCVCALQASLHSCPQSFPSRCWAR